MQARLQVHTIAIALFATFFVAMIAAFWPSYFSRLGEQPTYHAHAHGIAMVLWCAMLVAQAGLIALRRPKWHRWLGRTSFLLVPVIVFATLDFLHFRLSGPGRLGEAAFYFVALIVNALVAFCVIYGFAIVYRRNRALHARYMVATVFPLFTPVTDRLIGAHWPALAAHVPNIGGATVLPAIGFLLADLLLAALVAWDWLANRRFDAFATALAVTVLYHLSVLTFHELPAWRAFAEWFRTLPF